MQAKDYGPVFWAHLIVNIALLMSWLLFSWWLVLVGALLLQLQYLVFQGCILSRAEFGRDEACIPYYLEKWRLIKNKTRTRRFVRYILPFVVLLSALIWQLYLGHRPLIV